MAIKVVPHRTLTLLPSRFAPRCVTELPMLDLLYIFIGLGIFGAFAAYVYGLRGI